MWEVELWITHSENEIWTFLIICFKNNLIVTFFFLHEYSQDKMSNVCWKEEKKSYLQRNVVQIVQNAKTMRGMR